MGKVFLKITFIQYKFAWLTLCVGVCICVCGLVSIFGVFREGEEFASQLSEGLKIRSKVRTQIYSVGVSKLSCVSFALPLPGATAVFLLPQSSAGSVFAQPTASDSCSYSNHRSCLNTPCCGSTLSDSPAKRSKCFVVFLKHQSYSVLDIICLF